MAVSGVVSGRGTPFRERGFPERRIASTSISCILVSGFQSPTGGIRRPQSVRLSSSVDGLNTTSKPTKMTSGCAPTTTTLISQYLLMSVAVM